MTTSFETGLNRFVRAQDADGDYARAVAEITAGRKSSHWIWFVFPQVAGLGRSTLSRIYAIADLEEGRAYVAHSVLGPRLCEITSVALGHGPSSAGDIFGPDDVKFHSCMTLFALAAPEEAIFRDALSTFFGGELDQGTLAIVHGPASGT